MLDVFLSPHGMIVLGGFHPSPEDDLDAGTVLLIGSAGGAYWSTFTKARRDEPDPLDAWRRRVLDGVAQETGARALYPFEGPPYHPFQTWAVRATGLKPGPMGPLIHPDYGPWFAFHGALLFADPLDLPSVTTQPHPCDACADRPCLSACPVEAIAPHAYDIEACRTGWGACTDTGCQARRACPVGAEYAHGPDQAAFHMAAFQKSYG